jgi:replicative DNA helicase
MDDLKIPPHSIDAEYSIIGGLLIEPFRIDDLSCSADDFYTYQNRTVFSAMLYLAENNKPIDIITVCEVLESRNELDAIGGIIFMAELAKNTAGAGNIKRYAEIVREKALLRELIVISSSIAENAFSSKESASDIVADAESQIFSIMDKRETQEPVHIDMAVKEAIEHLGNVIDGMTYQSTGLDDLDNVIGGLRGGATYVVAARSSMGKTALMCSIAHHVAKEKPCYIATLEMPRREIAARLIAIDGKVNLGNAKEWGDDEYNRLTKAASTIQELNITIDHQEGLSLAQLRSRCRRQKRRKGLGCIFVDYLQLMKSHADTREREVAQISEGLKSLAKELDVPVVVLAQLNRDCDKRNDKRPLMSDLRESGSIEQDADVIIMLYRDEVYNKDTQYKGMAELLIRKNRHGAIGDVYVQYTPEFMHFRNKAHDWMVPAEVVEYNNRKRGFD